MGCRFLLVGHDRRPLLELLLDLGLLPAAGPGNRLLKPALLRYLPDGGGKADKADIARCTHGIPYMGKERCTPPKAWEEAGTTAKTSVLGEEEGYWPLGKEAKGFFGCYDPVKHPNLCPGESEGGTLRWENVWDNNLSPAGINE